MNSETKIGNIVIRLEPPHFRGERFVVQVYEVDHWDRGIVRLLHSNAISDPEHAVREYQQHIQNYLERTLL